MSSAELVVRLESLRDAVEQMSAFERVAAELIDALDRRVRDLHACWSGQAAAEQRAAHQQWTSGARQMHETLAGLRETVMTAHGNYASAISANRRMWR